jgi:hypothetical protein
MKYPWEQTAEERRGAAGDEAGKRLKREEMRLETMTTLAKNQSSTTIFSGKFLPNSTIHEKAND